MKVFLLAELVNPNVNITAILPEMVVAAAGIVVMVYDSFFPKQRRVSGIVSLAGLAVAAILLAMMWTGGQPASAFNGMIAHDGLRLAFSFVFLIVTALTILTSTVWVENEDIPVGEIMHC